MYKGTPGDEAMSAGEPPGEDDDETSQALPGGVMRSGKDVPAVRITVFKTRGSGNSLLGLVQPTPL